jgi:hypothetical protein
MSTKTFQWKHPRCLRKGDTFKLANGHTRVVRQVVRKKGHRTGRSMVYAKCMVNDRLRCYVYIGNQKILVLRSA